MKYFRSLLKVNEERLYTSLFVRLMVSILSGFLLFQSIASQISLEDSVLCITDNGDIILENSGEDIHCTHPEDPVLLDQLADNDYHEDNCLDIPLDQGREWAELQKKQKTTKGENKDTSFAKLYFSSQNDYYPFNKFTPPSSKCNENIVLLI